MAAHCPLHCACRLTLAPPPTHTHTHTHRDPETWREAYPRAYKIHKLLNKPDNIKRFIIGRQFCTVLTGFLLAQIFTLNKMTNTWGWPDALYYIVVKSGLIGVMIVLAHGQLMPELLAAEYPLRFMDMYGSYSVCYMSLFFDSIGVGHHAWAVYYATRPFCCKSLMAGQASVAQPEILRVQSAELLAATGSPLGNGAKKPVAGGGAAGPVGAAGKV